MSATITGSRAKLTEHQREAIMEVAGALCGAGDFLNRTFAGVNGGEHPAAALYYTLGGDLQKAFGLYGEYSEYEGDPQHEAYVRISAEADRYEATLTRLVADWLMGRAQGRSDKALSPLAWREKLS